MSAQLNSHTRHAIERAMLWYFLLNQNIAAWFAQVSIYTLSNVQQTGWFGAFVQSRISFFLFVYVPDTLQYTIYQYSWTRIFGESWLCIMFGVQTYYFFTFRAPDLSGINFYIQSSATGKDRIYDYFFFHL